jgi:predicted nucleic acid-binding Zn ribbon protein
MEKICQYMIINVQYALVAIEFKREFGEDREPSCCNSTMQRQWSSPGVMFNAPGFYSTDNRK